jgi:hypothetical protein
LFLFLVFNATELMVPQPADAPIGKYVSKVGAYELHITGALHSVGVIFLGFDARLESAGVSPACTGIEFVSASKSSFLQAPFTNVSFCLVILAERTPVLYCANLILVRRQLFFHCSSTDLLVHSNILRRREKKLQQGRTLGLANSSADLRR